MDGEGRAKGEGETAGSSRREFLGALGGVVGVALTSDPIAIAARAAGVGGPSIPSGYAFHRLFTTGDGTAGLGDVEEVMPGVMINDRSEVIFHARTGSGGRAVYRLPISRERRPEIERPRLIVATGQEVAPGFVAERIAAGDTNGRGTFVTVIRGAKDLNAVFMQRQGRPLRQLLAAGDRTPGKGPGRYSGSFGDVDVDAFDSILLSARYSLPGKVRHGLFLLPAGNRDGGRILMRTGHRIPNSRATVTGFGLIERRGRYFVAQVFGRQPRHRRKRNLPIEPSGFLVGRVDAGRREQRLLAGARMLGVQRSVVEGDAIVGPRIHRDGTAATVVHRRDAQLQMHRRGRHGGAEKLLETGDRGFVRGSTVETISAPVFGADGLLFYRAIGKHSMRLHVASGTQRRKILESGDRIDGERVRIFNVGWHTDQVDGRGRLAFQAQLEDGRTAIVIGTPI